MSKHTPRPWVWTGTELERDSPDNDFFPVIELGIVDGKQTLFMTDADRALIAAAPEMLDALCEIYSLSCGEDDDEDTEVMLIARRAIQKARGEE